MVKDNFIEWIGVVLLFLFGVSMFIQGHFIFHGKRGYRHCERDQHDSINTRRRLEELLKDQIHDDME